MELNLSYIKALPFDFGNAIEAHIKALKAHQTTVGEPAPIAHALVERAVRRVQYPIDAKKPDDFVADYTVVDDTPPPPTLDQRKTALAVNAQALCQEAMDAASPPLKRRLADMEAGRAMMVDPAKRTPAQLAAIAAQQARGVKSEAILFHLATLESQIHDLTEQTIDGWKPAPFPK
jgi:hypothetical protein